MRPNPKEILKRFSWGRNFAYLEDLFSWISPMKTFRRTYFCKLIVLKKFERIHFCDSAIFWHLLKTNFQVTSIHWIGYTSSITSSEHFIQPYCEVRTCFLQNVNINDLNENLPQPKKKKISKKAKNRRETKTFEHCLEEQKSTRTSEFVFYKYRLK